MGVRNFVGFWELFTDRFNLESTKNLRIFDKKEMFRNNFKNITILDSYGNYKYLIKIDKWKVITYCRSN